MAMQKADVYVDFTYGVLILVGCAVIVGFDDTLPAVTFGVGVMLAYAVHVGWRMTLFDPDDASAIGDEVEDRVSSELSDIQDTVDDRVSDIEDSVDDVSDTVSSVEDDVSDIKDE